MNKKELVSVITPLFNSEEFIVDTIRSVQCQSYRNWELIVFDDGSKDDGPNMVREIAEKDNRIKLFKNEINSGPAVTRNNAIKAANGRFIAFLDSDDQWAPDKLDKQVDFMIKNDFALSFTEYTLIDEAGFTIGVKNSLPKKVDYKKMLGSNYIGCLTAMYDSEKLGKVYMPEILKRQDYGLWLTILKKVKYAYCLKETLALYRVRSSSVSSNKLNLIKYNWKLFREVEGLSLFLSSYYLSKNILNKIIK